MPRMLELQAAALAQVGQEVPWTPQLVTLCLVWHSDIWTQWVHHLVVRASLILSETFCQLGLFGVPPLGVRLCRPCALNFSYLVSSNQFRAMRFCHQDHAHQHAAEDIDTTLLATGPLRPSPESGRGSGKDLLDIFSIGLGLPK